MKSKNGSTAAKGSVTTRNARGLPTEELLRLFPMPSVMVANTIFKCSFQVFNEVDAIWSNAFLQEV
jgi:hypothetical protein